MNRFQRVLNRVIVCWLVFISLSSVNAAEPDNWEQLRAGTAIALMRHALAPGNGDPTNFQVDDCSTQRNLSEQGRDQSARIGDVMRLNGIERAEVYSSQWCRCMDTGAGLMFNKKGEQPIALPIMNSFYQDRSTAEDQTRKLENWIIERLEKANSDPMLTTVLVSHQVNISALTNVFLSSGEIVFIGLNEGNLAVLGTHLTE